MFRYSPFSSEVLGLISLSDGTRFVNDLQSCYMLDFQSFHLLVYKIVRKIFQHVVPLRGTWGLHLPGWHPRRRCHHSAARQQHHGGWVHSGQTKWHQETLLEEPQEPLPGSDVKLDFLPCRSMPLFQRTFFRSMVLVCDKEFSRPELWQEGSPQWIAINLLSFLTVFSCCRHPKSQREVLRRRGGIELWQRMLRVKRLKHSYRTGSFDIVEGMGA